MSSINRPGSNLGGGTGINKLQKLADKDQDDVNDITEDEEEEEDKDKFQEDEDDRFRFKDITLLQEKTFSPTFVNEDGFDQ